MGESHVVITFDKPVVAGLSMLTSRVSHLCPSPLRGKGLVHPTSYHLTAYYGFCSSVGPAAIQSWLDQEFSTQVHLRPTALLPHPSGNSNCWAVRVESFGLLRLHECLRDHPLSFEPAYKHYLPHISLGWFRPHFDLRHFPPAVDPFGPEGALGSLVKQDRLECWFVDGATKAATQLFLRN